MKYVVMSTTAQDTIHFPNNDAEICAAGGAGMYALAGMRVWEEDVGIVSGVGEDYAGLFGKWYHENAVTTVSYTHLLTQEQLAQQRGVSNKTISKEPLNKCSVTFGGSLLQQRKKSHITAQTYFYRS